ncbi:hypothetical protein BK026_02245 [Alteromonas sp. V450]|uniref:glycosyltransferase n=1 Tax=Alteromonas sp. V450 TaxID=1912139 RepID=UPI0008FF6D18|nr:glycosyltransferase [Alteromonas sp. V450]OJF67699.1 hypothetical protein BK026_02245 [Alteromonas sp. V450]
MIFLTTGTQLPFDRLVYWMDHFCKENPEVKCFGQIGNSNYVPNHFRWVENLDFFEFDRAFEKAELVVAHAGMGTILTSLCEGKNLLVVPRKSTLREHRNNHQEGTAKKFSVFENCAKAETYQEFSKYIAAFLNAKSSQKTELLPKFAPASTLNALAEILKS